MPEEKMMKIKEKHKLRKPSGSNLVGSKHFSYEYDSIETDGKSRVIPCLCFYPAKDIGERKLKAYVNESIIPGTNGIETNSYINAPIYDSKPRFSFSAMVSTSSVKRTRFNSRNLLLMVIWF